MRNSYEYLITLSGYHDGEIVHSLNTIGGGRNRSGRGDCRVGFPIRGFRIGF